MHFVFESAATRAAAGSSLVAVDGLDFAYPGGRFRIRLRDLNVVAGERVVLLGPNGHGKSTLFNVLTGALTGAAGKATLTASVGFMLPPLRF